MLDINGWEFLIILVVAAVVIGPERLPHYVAQLRGWIRSARDLAEGARGQLREQMGPEFDNVDWKAYDPRQYDPRRIVREALMDDPPPVEAPAPVDAEYVPVPRLQSYDPDVRTPYDNEAT